MKLLDLIPLIEAAAEDPNTLFVYENNSLGNRIDWVLMHPNYDWSIKKPPSEGCRVDTIRAAVIRHGN